ncbi:hypothetical protein DDB_G0268926 [Dictyostelium discoideum AX4]|uniref:Poly(A) RNA polymerase mitochondrial-like central palm domain-containing protein n=1 Tax=Dictyostelium discoideum TaxID=44689 RepID=Q55F25_DICDI|nr:hypothetical protein DDB_G0268926 [Dictyostelium discoideum AX4]EAL73052.1 hypothetical protein DDB_G0268926 [Dictyostelium discoideum AX4]|eukprot:XP_646845.1 hypothetical protein DDB_G0268926 [Dictyostelium discoideum AX4]
MDAKIPIIRFKEISSGIHFDMCFNSMISYHNSLLLGEYCSIDNRCIDLALLVKWWAISKDLNNAAEKTFSSFCLVNMVIHFLQSLNPPILPTFFFFKTNVPKLILTLFL